jgi:TonB family protein
MTPRSLRVAETTVRAWTRIYTWRMPPELRDARREEVESDLWESEHDPHRPRSALAVLVRLSMGVADDVAWRVEQENIMHRFLTWRAAALIFAGVVVVLTIAVTQRLTPRPPSPHGLPPTLRAGLVGSANIPPPPPPPPPPPQGWTAGGRIPPAPSPQYGKASFTVAAGMPAPHQVKDVQPVYPPIAAAYGLRGTVTLYATVDERGRVVQARIVRSIPVFDQSVLHAVRQWEFQPAVVEGTPVNAVIAVTARFGAE